MHVVTDTDVCASSSSGVTHSQLKNVVPLKLYAWRHLEIQKSLMSVLKQLEGNQIWTQVKGCIIVLGLVMYKEAC